MSLTLEDFENRKFDIQKPVYTEINREISGRISATQERAIEGETFTDNLKKVGYAYFPSDGMLLVN